MCNKLILISGLIFSCSYLNAKIYLPQGKTIQHIQKESKPIEVAWDIHEVLGKKDGMAKFGTIMSNIFTIGWTKLTDNDAWNEISSIPKRKDLSGEAYSQIFLKHKQRKLAKMAQEAANAYKPREGMEQLIRDIKNAGITQRFASNIGPQCLEALNLKFKSKHHNHMLEIIQPGKVVDYNWYGNAIPNTSTEVSSIGKPHPRFFDSYNKTYNADNKTLIIFIDDKIENIRTATAQGWIGIHIDPTQKDKAILNRLRSELQLLGVFVKKS